MSIVALVVPLLAGICARPAMGAVIPVTTTSQRISGSGGCSLQEAIYAANFDASLAIAGYTGSTPNVVATGCVAGSGDDIIVLPAGAVFSLYKAVDDADNPAGPTATPMITSTLTILAYGATLRREASLLNFRLFAVGPTGHLTIRRAFIRGFRAQGGSGVGGGGGGMGAGGAIYVMGGTLAIESSAFHDNHAMGGESRGSHGGGGGGLGGNGGDGHSTGGGGGGGARGDGGQGEIDGGGGGGTVGKGAGGASRIGGFDCGGDGGSETHGHDGRCPGGGGGGGGSPHNHEAGLAFARRGGDGHYGGGGGAGADIGKGSGGHGGFGGGGGAAHLTYANVDPGDGGDGGFGGGGGAAGQAGFAPDGVGGSGGFFAGNGSSDDDGGGGGAGLGGAIFNDRGSVDIRNTTFNANTAFGGVSSRTQDGSGGGGAIFSRNGQLIVRNSTLSGNFANFGGGIIAVQDSADAPTALILMNSIVAGNGQYECAIAGISIGVAFAANLIQSNALDGSEYHRETFTGCGGIVASGDPQLGPLQPNQGPTPTMAIGLTSPAWNAADPATSLPQDQRRQERPAMGGFDIGAFELCVQEVGTVQHPCPVLVGVEMPDQVPMQLTMQMLPADGGTITPPPGTQEVLQTQVIAVTATPKPGFRFVEWSPNVTTPGDPSTTIFVNTAETITATFVTCACAVDVSQSVSVSRGEVTEYPRGRYSQNVTVTNVSSNPISGPIALVLDDLTADVTLDRASGSTTLMLPASAYVDAKKDLAPGESLSFKLDFTSAGSVAFTYDTRVLAGLGVK